MESARRADTGIISQVGSERLLHRLKFEARGSRHRHTPTIWSVHTYICILTIRHSAQSNTNIQFHRHDGRRQLPRVSGCRQLNTEKCSKRCSSLVPDATNTRGVWHGSRRSFECANDSNFVSERPRAKLPHVDAPTSSTVFGIQKRSD